MASELFKNALEDSKQCAGLSVLIYANKVYVHGEVVRVIEPDSTDGSVVIGTRAEEVTYYEDSTLRQRILKHPGPSKNAVFADLAPKIVKRGKDYSGIGNPSVIQPVMDTLTGNFELELKEDNEASSQTETKSMVKNKIREKQGFIARIKGYVTSFLRMLFPQLRSITFFNGLNFELKADLSAIRS